VDATRVGDDGRVTFTIDEALSRVDWARAKALLAADDFDNGRSPEALKRSFEESQFVVLAWVDADLIGMARMLTDGVCNAYLLDVWTRSDHRRRGVASRMVRHLITHAPGQHVGLQTSDAQPFYESLGFTRQPEFLSLVIGTWLDNDANT
jgi:GNAT superfamily N-acetyltransferase